LACQAGTLASGASWRKPVQVQVLFRALSIILSFNLFHLKFPAFIPILLIY